MKNLYMIIVFVITLSFLLIPLLAAENDKTEETLNVLGTSVASDSIKVKSDYTKLEEIKLYLGNEKKVVTLKAKEYLVGVVSAEMSAENEQEALKAQALAAYTYAYRKHIQNQQSNNEYDLTDDSKLDQRYLNINERKEKWGTKFDEYENKITKAVEAVENKLIVYKNEPILAAYHKVSAGKTETAKNVWGTDYPYLQSENSVGDLLCPEFYSEVVISVEEFSKKLADLGSTPGEDPSKFIGEKNKSPAGTVLNIKLGGKSFTGAEIREAFDLKSAAFDLMFKEEKFVFSVSGHGHGVGMSQYGANYMAQQGSDCKEIIASYYRGCEIIELK